MARIIIAVVYIAAILVIGILAGRNVKTSEEFATANRGIPFWTNVFSMSSAWIGAGSTLGCASMCYAYGVSGFYLAIGVGIGAMLSSLLFARKIRDENVSTIPELIRKHLGNKCADAIALLSIFSVFSVVASQIRSLGTILNMFVPQLSLLTAQSAATWSRCGAAGSSPCRPRGRHAARWTADADTAAPHHPGQPAHGRSSSRRSPAPG